MKMRPYLLFPLILMAFALSAGAQSRIQFGQFAKDVTSTASAIVTTNLMVRSVTLIGKDEFRVASADTVYVGFSATEDAQYYPLAPDTEVVMTAPENKTFNLRYVYVDSASAPATIIVLYVPE